MNSVSRFANEPSFVCRNHVLMNPHAIEDDAASIYTRSVLLKFQDELYKCGSYVVTPVVHGAQYMVSVAPSKVKDATKRKWRNVKIDDDR